MWEPILRRIGELAKSRGKWIIGGVFLVAIGMALAIPGLKISSSYRDLMPEDSPEQKTYDAFLEEFGAANDLIVVLEGEPEKIRKVSDQLAERLLQRGAPIEDVFHRIDLEEMVGRAPLYMEMSMLESVVEGLSSQKQSLAMMAEAKGMPELLERAAMVMSGSSEEAGWDPATAKQGLGVFNGWFDAWIARMTGSEMSDFSFPLPDSEETEELVATLQSGGYLGSHDSRMVFLFVRPDQTIDAPPYLETVEQAAKEEWQALQKSEPELTAEVKLALTGLPAHILTDVRSLREDILRSAVPSAILVFSILWIGLRSIRRTLTALIALGCGMAISLGLARFVFVELNRMSMSFLAIMFGIGIDFAIYLIRRTDEEISGGMDREQAVKRALLTSGQGIIAGGLVTALAFSVTAISEFRGTSQLGLTTGISVVVVLVTTLLFLPPVLMRTKVPGRSLSQLPRDPLSKGGGPGVRSVRAGLLGVLCFTALGVTSGFRVPMDYNGLSVMPQNADSTVYQIRMQEESDFQMSSAVIQANDRESMAALVDQVRALPSVAKVVSLGDLMPTEQQEKIDFLKAHAEVFDIEFPEIKSGNVPPDASAYQDGLSALEESLLDAQDLAFSGGQAELTGLLQETIERVGKLKQLFEEQPDLSMVRSDQWETEMQSWMKKGQSFLRAWKSLEPMTEDSLPPGFVNRFRSSRGNYAAFVYPSGSIWEVKFLRGFLEDLRPIAPAVTGFPVISERNIELLTTGIFHSLFLTVAVVVVLLFFDLKKWSLVAYALFPLLVGMALLQMVLYVTGQGYNLASINGLPLLLGLGVVYGVHIVHRWAEAPNESAFRAVKTSGRAISLAGITTIAGLASLTFCVHRGVATFGWLLLQGIACMLVAALVALPLLIDCVSVRKKSDGNQTTSREPKGESRDGTSRSGSRRCD